MDKVNEWPYVLKPRWVHDLLVLWRRKQPYDNYLDQVTDYSVREIRDQTTRRCCVAWLAAHFAPSRSALTLTQNVWASYSHHFRANDLAPAYLTYLTLREPFMRCATTTFDGQLAPGMPVGRALLRTINAAPGALETLMRTLVEWGVLAVDPRQGGYLVEKRLRVAPPIFPLLVWSWWLDTRQQSVSLAEFRQSPSWAWMEKEDFCAGWEQYVGRLWTLEKESGEPTVYLHPVDSAGFVRALLNLLSTDGRKGRQLPRHIHENGDMRRQSAEAILQGK